jgi:hypothetical protein
MDLSLEVNLGIDFQLKKNYLKESVDKILGFLKSNQ